MSKLDYIAELIIETAAVEDFNKLSMFNKEMFDKENLSYNVIKGICGGNLENCLSSFVDLCSFYYIWDRDAIQSSSTNSVSWKFEKSLNIKGERNNFKAKAVDHRDFLLLAYYNLAFYYGYLYKWDYPDDYDTPNQSNTDYYHWIN